MNYGLFDDTTPTKPYLIQKKCQKSVRFFFIGRNTLSENSAESWLTTIKNGWVQSFFMESTLALLFTNCEFLFIFSRLSREVIDSTQRFHYYKVQNSLPLETVKPLKCVVKQDYLIKKCYFWTELSNNNRLENNLYPISAPWIVAFNTIIKRSKPEKIIQEWMRPNWKYF